MVNASQVVRETGSRPGRSRSRGPWVARSRTTWGSGSGCGVGALVPMRLHAARRQADRYRIIRARQSLDPCSSPWSGSSAEEDLCADAIFESRDRIRKVTTEYRVPSCQCLVGGHRDRCGGRPRGRMVVPLDGVARAGRRHEPHLVGAGRQTEHRLGAVGRRGRRIKSLARHGWSRCPSPDHRGTSTKHLIDRSGTGPRSRRRP